MSEERVTIKFDGQSHQVDVATFTQVLLNYATVIRAAAKESGLQDGVRVSIVATEPGSLDAVVSVAAQAGSGLLSFLRDNKDGIDAAIIAAAGLYGFKQKLSGKSSVSKVDEKPEENITIINIDGDINNIDSRVYNTYVNHPDATSAIDSSFAVLEENPEIEAVQMSTGENILFRADHSEFSGIAASPNYEGPGIRHISNEAFLQVVKPCLVYSKSRKWEFLYNGQKISAAIADESFLGELDSKRFGVGTKMRVLLDITQEYNARWRGYANKKYLILKVYEVDDPPTTDSMF